MAKGDYYFPLFYKRLLTSTIGWKDEEFGAYLRLLINQFDNGFISSDLNDLKRVAPSIKKHWPLISKKFKEVEKGKLVNDVMDEIYHSIQIKKEKNKENGKSGGRPKNNQTVTEPKPNGSKNKTEMKPIPIINKPIINNKKTKEEKEKIKPPTLEEVALYFKQKGYSEESARKAFEYYDVNQWRDKDNKKVLNWKQKMISVWFKPENLIHENNRQKQIQDFI